MTNQAKKYKLSTYPKWLIGLFFITASFPLAMLVYMNINIYNFAIPAIIIMQIYLIFRLRNVQLLLMGFIYIFFYFLFFIPYFYFDISLSQYTTFQYPKYFNNVLFLFYLFYLGATLATTKDINSSKIRLKDIIKISTSPIITFLYVCGICVVLYFVFKQGVNVLEVNNSYANYIENVATVNSLPLFSVLFIFFIPFIIKNKTLKNIIFITLIGILVFYCVSRGFRMILVPIGFLIYFNYFDQKIKLKYMFAFMLLGFVSMGYVNSLKKGENFKMIYLFSESDEYILSHHADALYASACVSGLLEQKEIDVIDRLNLNLGFLSEIIIPPTILPSAMKYPHIISTKAQQGGGGLFINAVYLMWGYLGIVVFGYLLITFVRLVYEVKNNSLALIASIVLIFIMRWISYDFHVIIRFPFLGFLIFGILNHFRILKVKNNENNRNRL